MFGNNSGSLPWGSFTPEQRASIAQSVYQAAQAGFNMPGFGAYVGGTAKPVKFNMPGFGAYMGGTAKTPPPVNPTGWQWLIKPTKAAPIAKATASVTHNRNPSTDAGPPPITQGHVPTVDSSLAAQVRAALTGDNNGGLSISYKNAPTVDPNLYGQTLAQMQFGPAIAEIMRQQAAVRGDLGPQLANLNKWSDAVQAQADQGASSNAQANQQALAAATQAAQRIGSSVGGDAGYQVAQQGINATNSIAAQGAQQAAINDALKTGIAQNLMNEKATATGQNSTALNDLRAKLVDALSGAGQTREQGFLAGQQLNQQNRSQDIQNRSVLQNMKLASELAAPQIVAAKLGNIGTAANIRNSNIATKASIQNTVDSGNRANLSLADQLKNSALQRKLALASQAVKGQTLQQKLGDPGFAGALHNYVWSGGLVGSDGRMVANPQAAYLAILNKLQTTQAGANPMVLSRLAASEVQSALPHSRYQGAWKFNGSQWVKTK